jgi:site-specific recombinase XerD
MDQAAESPLIRSFERHLRAENRSGRTIATYLVGLRQADAFLRARGTTLEAVTRADLEAFLADVLLRRSASTAATYYKPLKLLYAWLVEEEEIAADPMRHMKRPMVPDKPVPIVPADGLKRLFRACAGNTFEARRDTALIMLLLDTGARRDEMAGLKRADVDLELDVLLVLGKGRRERTLPYGHKAGEALDRYLRARARHKDAELPWLWLGRRGRLTEWGLVMMLRRRGAQAGLPGLHPHQFRHTFAHQWLAQGGTETDLMRIAGWKSRAMLQRYGASAADARGSAVGPTASASNGTSQKAAARCSAECSIQLEHDDGGLEHHPPPVLPNKWAAFLLGAMLLALHRAGERPPVSYECIQERRRRAKHRPVLVQDGLDPVDVVGLVGVDAWGLVPLH